MGSISGKYSPTGSVLTFSCVGDPTQERDATFILKVASSPVSGYTDVYPTNIDGLGVRYNFALNTGTPSFCPINFDDGINNSCRQYTCHIYSDQSVGLSLGSSVQYVVYKNNLKMGAITIPAVTASYSLNNEVGEWSLPMVHSGQTSQQLKVLSCNVPKSSLALYIGSFNINQFRGKGNTAAWKDFTIPLNCTAGTRIKVTVTANMNDATNGIIQQSNTGQPGAASGIGVQLWKTGTGSYANGVWDYGTTSNDGTYNMGVSSRQIQTGDSAQAGQVDATATMAISYY